MRSKILIIALTFLLSTISVVGQTIPTPINRLIKKVQKRGADTILVYLSGCGGCEIKPKPADCTCLINPGIHDVFILFKIKGEIYIEDLTCCRESSPTKINGSLSIPFFLSLKEMMEKKKEYYKKEIEAGRFFPPIPTDTFYEVAEFIVPNHRYIVSLSSSQRTEDYKIWKQYFWIDDEIKLLDFVRKDIGIQIKTSSIPID